MSRPTPPISSLLRRRRDDIVGRWAAIERGRRPELRRFEERELINSMPDLIDELAEHLEAHGEDARFDAPTIETSVEHGLQRLRLRIPLARLIEEYAVLRRVITRIAGEEGLTASAEELEQFHALLDLAMRRAAVAHAAAADTARDRIMGIVSHDLRNPLNAISLGSQALLARARDESDRRMLGRVLRSTDRALRMIHDLLDYARASSGRGLAVHPRVCDAAEIVEGIVDEMRQAFPAHPIDWKRPEAPVEGSWDGDRVAQAFANLLRNAVQHSLAGAPVTVRLRASASRVEIDVHNLGEPIDPAVLPRLFEPFEQGLGAGVGSGNVGLGLYIAHEVARAHGGEIGVRSAADQGTTFTLSLPR